MIVATDINLDFKKLLLNNYANTEITVEENENDDPLLLEDNLLWSLNFPTITSPYIEIIRQIERFSLLEKNWDGYNALPLSNTVAEKSKIIIENIDFDLYYNNDYDVKITPYSTVVVDWYNGENEFSLEIGKDYLGYYCDGSITKEVARLDITTPEQISNAIIQVEEDLRKVL